MSMGYFISWQLLALIAFSDLLRSDQSEVLLKSRGVPNLDWGSYMVPQLRELKRDTLVITKAGIAALEARLK